ncbi:MAG: PhoH family protein, partial [Spirochaetaceae bacterium]|nr:PhoH family protein [Spirochaetaceae bacterium]
MPPPAAVALDNLNFLRELCGPNDRNLRTFERLLGFPVRSRGNELLLDCTDPLQQRRFAAMLEWLREQAAGGREIDRFAVAAAHDAVSTAPPAAAAEAALRIPGGGSRIYARSATQARYLAAIDRYEMVVAVGPAGTGKTFLAVAAALRAVIGREKRRLVLTRPVVEAGESLGFLPGDLAQKIDPYLRPLYDAMDALVPGDTLRRLEETRAIEIAPLAYMRGRTLTDSYVILDEAQNTTREQMKMFLTRLGEGTRAVITGDITQIDLPRR